MFSYTTGTESDQIHVYLITGSSADIDHLHNAVTYRIQRLKQNSSNNTASPDSTSHSAKRKVDSASDEVRLCNIIASDSLYFAIINFFWRGAWYSAVANLPE